MDYLLGLVDPVIDRIPLDHSKNERYLFLTICSFSLKRCCSIDTEMLKEVVKQHHAAESHHSEFELYNKITEITSLDILETAVDRLSCNL